jgi:hypothetical protein
MTSIFFEVQRDNFTFMEVYPHSRDPFKQHKNTIHVFKQGRITRGEQKGVICILQSNNPPDLNCWSRPAISPPSGSFPQHPIQNISYKIKQQRGERVTLPQPLPSFKCVAFFTISKHTYRTTYHNTSNPGYPDFTKTPQL